MERLARRHFFRLFAHDALVASEQALGVRHMRLDLFPEVPDSKVCQLIPRILPGLRISDERGEVYATRPEGQRIRLFPVDDPRARIFCLFNGGHTIQVISSTACQTFGWTPEKSVATVRSMFFRLAKLGIVGTCNCWQD
jgi:hypothetical protein